MFYSVFLSASFFPVFSTDYLTFLRVHFSQLGQRKNQILVSQLYAKIKFTDFVTMDTHTKLMHNSLPNLDFMSQDDGLTTVLLSNPQTTRGARTNPAVFDVLKTYGLVTPLRRPSLTEEDLLFMDKETHSRTKNVVRRGRSRSRSSSTRRTKREDIVLTGLGHDTATSTTKEKNSSVKQEMVTQRQEKVVSDRRAMKDLEMRLKRNEERLASMERKMSSMKVLLKEETMSRHLLEIELKATKKLVSLQNAVPIPNHEDIEPQASFSSDESDSVQDPNTKMSKNLGRLMKSIKKHTGVTSRAA